MFQLHVVFIAIKKWSSEALPQHNNTSSCFLAEFCYVSGLKKQFLVPEQEKLITLVDDDPSQPSNIIF